MCVCVYVYYLKNIVYYIYKTMRNTIVYIYIYMMNECIILCSYNKIHHI